MLGFLHCVHVGRAHKLMRRKSSLLEAPKETLGLVNHVPI